MAADQAREAEAMEWCSSLGWGAGLMPGRGPADQARLTRQLGMLSNADMLAVEDAIKVQLGLPR